VLTVVLEQIVAAFTKATVGAADDFGFGECARAGHYPDLDSAVAEAFQADFFHVSRFFRELDNLVPTDVDGVMTIAAVENLEVVARSEVAGLKGRLGDRDHAVH
jgi:hypothetical protein